MSNPRILYLLVSTLWLASCSSEMTGLTEHEETQGVVTITSSIDPFDGEPDSRVNVTGDNFLDGDLIRMKIICPFVTSGERGEYTDGNSYDSFYHLKRSGSDWVRVVAADGYDIAGTYSSTSSPDFSTYYQAQQTPYVFVATTWSEERRFVANGTLYNHLTPVFHADQTKEKHYRASDVLWAQTFMQTGSWNIHLGFQHKMACLDITIDDVDLTQPNPKYDPEDPESPLTIPAPITDAAVLTLKGMPDIDQAEIVVGDYYADASKYNSQYGYQQKSSCSYANNGKVLGIAVNDEKAKRAKVAPLTGLPAPGGANSNYTPLAPVRNTATYTAYKEATKHYRLIVPPCNLDPNSEGGKNAVFWLIDGTRRFSIPLEFTTFEEGKLYPITLKFGTKPEIP